MTVDLDVAIRVLRWLTPVSASVAFVTIALGLTTSSWLFSEEKMPNPKFNRTGDPELEYLSKFTVSGLWTLCYTNPGETERNCFNIDYFPTEEYSPDPNDSTLSIPYAVLRAAPFFFLASVLLAVGEVACFLGHFVPKRRYCTFLSGVTFILSGLLLLLGLVVYVSVFTAEIGSKLRPSSSLQPPLFTYTYGYSFHMVVTAFLAGEVAGTSAIFLFIYWHRNRIAKKEMHRKMALALVQTPVDLSCQTAHGHLLAVPPPPPVLRRQTSPFFDRPTMQRDEQDSDGQPECHHRPCQHQVYHTGCDHQCHYQQLKQKQCNGFVKVPCSCSSSNNPVPTDDESSIPTPPPAVTLYQRTAECPVHCQRSSAYVTVHSPADAACPRRKQLALTNKKSHDNRDSSMPDITAFQNHTSHPCRQFSTDSETSSYNKVGSSRGPEQQHQVRTICYQCHGAGHVSVPVVPERCRPYAGSLPRDLTTSTMCGVETDSPEDEMEPERQHHHHHDDCSFQEHQRRHSSGTAYQSSGSLRRITAV